MRTTRWFTALAATLWVLIQGPASSTLAQTETTISVLPPSSQVGVGLTTMVEIRVEDVTGLYGLDIRLSFDPAVVQVADADESKAGVQVGTGELLQPDFLIRNTADNSQGSVWFAVTQLNPTAEVTGSGVAFVVLFRGIQPSGGSPLQVTYAKLVSRNGEAIPALTADGEVSVVAASDAPPPATPVGQPGVTPSARPQPTMAPTLGGVPLPSSTTVSSPPAGSTPGAVAPKASAVATMPPALTGAPGGSLGTPTAQGSQPGTAAARPTALAQAPTGSTPPAARGSELSAPLVLAGMASVLVVAGIVFAVWLLRARSN